LASFLFGGMEIIGQPRAYLATGSDLRPAPAGEATFAAKTTAPAGTPDTLPKLLLYQARSRGERPALREKALGIWQTWTWRRYAGEACALAAALGERGLGRGHYLAIVGDNRPRLYVTMAAAQCLGAVPVPLYEDCTAAELEFAIQNTAIAHVLVEGQAQVDRLLEILPRCPSLQHVGYVNPRGMRHYDDPMLASYDQLIARGRQIVSSDPSLIERQVAAGHGSDAAALFYTPGTSGVPKGVVLSYASVIERAKTLSEWDGLTDRDVVFASMPPAWLGQSMFSYVQPLVVGHSVCCPESAETILSDMREIGPTYYFAPPRVFEARLSQMSLRMEDAGALQRKMYHYFMSVARRVKTYIQEGRRVGIVDRIRYLLGNFLVYAPLQHALGMSRVRVAYAVGDAIDADLSAVYRSLGINLKQLYGSTETSFVVCVQRDGRVTPDRVGPPLPGVELKLSPEGELLVRSPGLLQEYYADPEATRAAKDAEGWFHTGDVGYMDADGDLKIVGRMHDIGTLAGGAPLSPKYLENKLKVFPYIQEAVCFGHQQRHVSAIISIDGEAVRHWADKRGLVFTSYTDLASRSEVHDLVGDCIARMNRDLAADVGRASLQIRRFLILHKELDVDDDELTRTLSVRRRVIMDEYAPLVRALYSGRRSARLDARHHDDGSVGENSVELEIRDAKIVPSAAREANGLRR
jgi:long-chain acyl-CoA synthetase